MLLHLCSNQVGVERAAATFADLDDAANPERNVWPTTELPDLEDALLDLGRLMCHVATELLRCCEQLLRQETVGIAAHASAVDGAAVSGKTDAPRKSSADLSPRHRPQSADCKPEAGTYVARGGSRHLWKPVEQQRSNKARLLHYYPVPETGEPPQAWCGWHVDHGTLTGVWLRVPHMQYLMPIRMPLSSSHWSERHQSTEAGRAGSTGRKVHADLLTALVVTAGLTAAMFLPSDRPSNCLGAADEAPCPDAIMGLHVRTCGGDVVRVSAKPHQLLFQAGQCLQALSGGRLKATEHYVRGPSRAAPVSRETFAVFCQPKCAFYCPHAPEIVAA